eukprot:2161531-Amphidinium_carterae.1
MTLLDTSLSKVRDWDILGSENASTCGGCILDTIQTSTTDGGTNVRKQFSSPCARARGPCKSAQHKNDPWCSQRIHVEEVH